MVKLDSVIRSVGSYWIVPCIILFGVSGCAEGNKPQASNKNFLRSEDATISIQGDDSFVHTRYDRNVLYRDFEVLTFYGGFLSYEKAHPGYSLKASLHPKYEIVNQFNKFRPAKDRAMSVTEDDVRVGNNIYGTYSVVFKRTNRDACIRALQYFGTTDQPNSPGNQRVRIGACWAPGKGGKQTLEAFVRDLMSRVRFDTGAINRAKAGLAK